MAGNPLRLTRLADDFEQIVLATQRRELID
jgi:hypothetical protein